MLLALSANVRFDKIGFLKILFGISQGWGVGEIFDFFESCLVLFTPSPGRVRRPSRGLEKFFPPVLQRCYGCSFDTQEILHAGHGMCFFFFLFWRERCLHKVS